MGADTQKEPGRPRAWAVVPAGGRGRRMGGPTPKQYVEVAGAPLLVHTLRALLACPLIEAVVLVVPAGDVERAAGIVKAHGLTRLDRIIGPVAGGAERQDSVRAGLMQVPDGVDVIAVHDAVRPFPDPERLGMAIRLAGRGVGVVVGRPASDTIKRVDEKARITETPDRARLWQAFTPQVFPAGALVAAYAQAARDGTVGTDDAALVERSGEPVVMLEGDRERLKVTHPDDLAIVSAWLAKGH
jgi:2-C-methyl-D-erythritol 4-phosphate cytidylyltransferase